MKLKIFVLLLCGCACASAQSVSVANANTGGNGSALWTLTGWSIVNGHFNITASFTVSAQGLTGTAQSYCGVSGETSTAHGATSAGGAGIKVNAGSYALDLTATVGNPPVGPRPTTRAFVVSATANGVSKNITVVVDTTVPSASPLKCYVAAKGGDYGTLYHVFQDGYEVNSFFVNAGQNVVASFNTWNTAGAEIRAESLVLQRGMNGDLQAANSGVVRVVGSGSVGNTSGTAISAGNGNTVADGTVSGDVGTGGDEVWRATVTNGALTEDVFKQGIQKIVTAVNSHSGGGSGGDMTATNAKLDTLHNDLTGTAQTGVSLSQSNDQTVELDGSKALAVTSKLPVMPSVTVPNSEAAFAFAFDYKGITFDFGFDLSQWSTPIAVFKGLVRAALALWFFFLALRAVKESVA